MLPALWQHCAGTLERLVWRHRTMRLIRHSDALHVPAPQPPVSGALAGLDDLMARTTGGGWGPDPDCHLLADYF